MEKRILNSQIVEEFERYLIHEEKSCATQEKYLRDVSGFQKYLHGRTVTKEEVMGYKKHLLEQGYAISSINSMLASLHSLFLLMDWNDCKVKFIRQQRKMYCSEKKELSKAEYLRLLEASKKNQALWLILQTICSTGIRVSELQYFTVEAVNRGEIRVDCKGKLRTILIPKKLRKHLLQYAKIQKIKEGVIFRGKTGKPLNRSTIWSKMKRLCEIAEVEKSKVFPHNLRKLFARAFYQLEKDIAKLADVLGHSSINTTRIYIMTSGSEHRERIERLGLVI